MILTPPNVSYLCTLHICHPVVRSNYPNVLGCVHTFCIRRPWIFMKFHVRVFFEKTFAHYTSPILLSAVIIQMS